MYLFLFCFKNNLKQIPRVIYVSSMIASIQAAAVADAALDPVTQNFGLNYAFLFLGYKNKLYLWEVVVLARKGALSLIGVAYATVPRTQSMLGLLVLMVSLVLQAHFRPFTDLLMNQYELASLAISSLTFFLGVFTLDDDRLEYTVLAIGLNILYAFVTLRVGIEVRSNNERAQLIQKVCFLMGPSY